MKSIEGRSEVSKGILDCLPGYSDRAIGMGWPSVDGQLDSSSGIQLASDCGLVEVVGDQSYYLRDLRRIHIFGGVAQPLLSAFL